MSKWKRGIRIVGKDGKTPIPGIDFEIPQKGDKGDTPTIDELKKIIEPLIPEPVKVIEKIKELKGNDRIDINVFKGSEYLVKIDQLNSKLQAKANKKGLDMSDLRWHGGGLTAVSHDSTLTGTGEPTNPLGVVGGLYVTKTELASTTAPSGASLVGLEDVGHYFPTDDVESALQVVGAIGASLPTAYAKLDGTNQPFTGEVDVALADTVPGDLVISQMMATNDGSQYYTQGGFQFILKDLNYLFAGLGKYPMINSASDGVLDIDLILPPATLIADLTGGNPKLSFIGGAAFGTLALESNFNWDGLGHNRFFTSSDIYTSGDLTAFTSLHSATGYFTDIFSTTITLNSLMALYGDHIEMDISGASYIGNGGDAWLGYVKNNDDWLPGTLSGDIAYRSQANSLDFGNTEMAMQITGNNVDVKNELMGCRSMLFGVRQAAISASHYSMIPSGALAMSATVGWRALRAGSITGLAANLNVSAQTTQGDITIQARVNDSPVYTLVIASNGVAVVHGESTQARGTDDFSAGDLITLYIEFTTFVGTIATEIIECEIVYNT